jgi:hypothetical protein
VGAGFSQKDPKQPKELERDGFFNPSPSPSGAADAIAKPTPTGGSFRN